MIKDELIAAFENAGSSIISMVNEVETLEEKHGKNAGWLKKKRVQMENISLFYDLVRDRILFHEKMNHLLLIENQTLQHLMYKSQKQLNNEEFARIMGFQGLDKWKHLDTVDQKLKEYEEASKEFQEILAKATK